MATEAQIFAIGIITILIVSYAAQYEIRDTNFYAKQSQLLNVQIILTSVLTKAYENVRLGGCFKNKAKQTQSNPIFNPKLARLCNVFPFDRADITITGANKIQKRKSTKCGLD